MSRLSCYKTVLVRVRFEAEADSDLPNDHAIAAALAHSTAAEALTEATGGLCEVSMELVDPDDDDDQDDDGEDSETDRWEPVPWVELAPGEHILASQKAELNALCAKIADPLEAISDERVTEVVNELLGRAGK